GDRPDRVPDHRAHVAPFYVELEREVAAVRFAVDVGGAGGDADLRQLAQRRATAGRTWHRELADGEVVLARGRRQDQPPRARTLALPERGGDLAGERRADEVVGGRDRDAGARQRLAVEPDLELGHRGVAVQPEVDDARDRREPQARLLQRVAHHL